MAFVITHRLSGGSGTDATSYTTASVSVTAGDLLVVAFTNGDGTPPAEQPDEAIGGTLGSTLTWSIGTTVTSATTNATRTSIWTAACPSTTSGTLIFTISTLQSNAQWTICTVTGASNADPVRREQSLQYGGATTTMTLSPAPRADSMVIAAGNTNSATALTAGGTGYTFIGNGTAGTNPSAMHGVEYDILAPSATVGFTHTGTLNRGMCAIEIRPPATFTRTGALSGDGTLTASGVATIPESHTDSVSLSGEGTLTLAGQPSVSRTLARTGTGVSTYTGRSYTGDIVGSCHFEQNAPDLAFFFSDVGPGTPQPGDRAFLVWAHPSAVTPGSEPFKPTGFTSFGATSDNTAGASFWYRVLDGSESSIDMGLGTTYMQSAILVVMRGYSAFNSLIYTTDAGTDAIHTAPGSIMDLPNLGVLIGNCERSASGGSTSMTPPAGFTKLVDSYHKTTSGVYNTVAYEGSGNKIISARAGGASHVPGDMTNNAAQSDVITWTLLMVPPNQGSPGFTDTSGLSGSGTLTASGTASFPGLSFSGSVALSGAGTLTGNKTLITLLDFEGTTEGANLSAATLPTGWTYNETGSGFSSTTVAAAARNGTRGNHLTTTASTGTSYVKWDPAGNANVATRRVISFYFRANTAFSGSTEFASLKTVSGGSNCRFAFYPGTQLQFSLLGNTQVYITPKATVGVWYRIEMMCEGNQVELRAYNPDGSLFGSTTTGPNNQNTAVAWVGIVATSGSANANVDIDNVRYANDWLDSIPPELPLSGAGTLSLAGKPGVSGDTPLSGSGTLSLAGIAKPTGAITPNGAGTLSLTGIATPAQTLPLAGSGTLAFSGAKPAVSGSTTLSGVGLLNLSAGTNYSGFINPSGSGTLSLTGKVGLVGTTAYSGTGALSLVGVPKAVVTLALSGAGTLSGVGTPKLIVVRTLAGDGTLGGTGIKIGGGSDFIGALVLAGAGTANYAGKPAAKGALVLAGSGSLLLVALRKGTLDLTGSGVLSLTGMDLNLLRDVRIQVSAAYGYDLDVSGPEGAALLTHALRGYLLNVDGPVARAVEVGSAVGHRLRVEAFDEDPA